MNLLERIDHWANVTPYALAHISGQRSLTFVELKQRSNAVADHISQTCGHNRGPVAVLGHREPEMLVAFLGAVKAGHPYIPIDTALPKARIDHIFEVAKPALVLTTERTAKLPASNRILKSQPVEPNDAFYIIFTSGSTGQPKGIVITRRSLEFFVDWVTSEQRLVEGGEIFLNQAPFSFDLSVMDLYCSLATGGTLFSISRDLIADPKLLYLTLARSNITTWVSTPSFAEMYLIERNFDRLLMPNIRRFLFCGEILLADTARRLLERFPAAEVWNLYGPTETTVATTSVRIDADVLRQYSNLPVGRPAPGTKVFLRDHENGSVEPETRGEIFIEGPNVSAGYLGRPDLTALNFCQKNGMRCYRTGDLGTYRNGLLFFEGRKDDQIKLHGHRIELLDLEANLRALEIVHDAVVVPVAKNGKIRSLVAFVRPAQKNHSNFESIIRDRLRDLVPDYMVPRKFVVLNSFPMTANGKVDRCRLAESL